MATRSVTAGQVCGRQTEFKMIKQTHYLQLSSALVNAFSGTVTIDRYMYVAQKYFSNEISILTA